MRIEFTVTGYPPKKHGEKSMWAQGSSEAPRVACLREKAFEARLKAGFTEPFDSLIALELSVFVPKSQLEPIGDLDSFIAGVCDGLQAADPKVLPYLDGRLRELKGEADPRHALLIMNDAKVVSITARKVALDERQNAHYVVAIEPVGEDIVEGQQ